MGKFKDPHCSESNSVFLEYIYNSGIRDWTFRSSCTLCQSTRHW